MIRDARIPLKIGGDRTRIINVTGVPAGTSVSKAWLTVKNAIGDADNVAVFQLAITTSSGPAGQITDSGAVTGVAILVFNILAVNTTLLSEGVRYPYDVQIHFTSGTNDTVEEGTVIASQRVTLATS